MNAYEYIKERSRMCNSYEDCDDCPLGEAECVITDTTPDDDCKRIIDAVDKWSKEHPKKKKKTRQEVFLKQNPEARLDDYGVLRICPIEISAEYRDKDGDCLLLYSDCRDCRKDFWMAEVKGE